MKFIQAHILETGRKLEKNYFRNKFVEIIKISMKSVERSFDDGKKYCFTILGFDIIIDQNLECWLLEINSNPSLDSANAFVEKIKHRAVGSPL